MAAHANGRHMGLGDLVVASGLEYAESLVSRTLDFRGKASKGAQSALDSALDSYIRINGFRDASRAPSARLKGPILNALIDGNAAFARALFGVWAESRPVLRDVVRDYLDEDGAALNSDPDGLSWTDRELEEAINVLALENEELDEDDLGLMLCFVSGRSVQSDESGTEISSPLMRDFLEALEHLEPDAPAWEEITPFLRAVVELDYERRNRATNKAVAGVAARLEKAQRDYEEELAYLDLRSNVSAWAEESTLKTWLIEEALEIADELLQGLEEYGPIRHQASTRAEEAERAVARQAAEERILDIAARWRELMDRPLVDASDGPDDEWDDQPKEDPAETVDVELMEEVGELRAELEGVHRSYEESRAEIERVAGQRDGLAAEREALRADITRLEEELSSSRETVRIWRLAGVSARMEEAGLPASGQAEPRTVRDAVALAEKLFPDRLAVALNSKSDKRSQFQKPQEVFDTLVWLATDYHHRRANPGGSPDFDKLLKESCPGWSYKSSQTEITREQFEEWYTTTWDGRSYDLSPHLGKGTSKDPQNTIRIAFAWDDERRRVVVGYIGMHQRNRKS